MNEFVELADFLSLLDNRYDARVKKDGVTMAKKVRQLGLSSKSSPPSGAPDWTVDQNWRGSLFWGHVHFLLPYYGCLK